MRLFLLVLFFIFRFVVAEVLPFAQVFNPEIRQELLADNSFKTEIKIELPAKYYLYKNKLKLENQDLVNAQISFSPSIEKTDPFVGKTEIYNNEYPAELIISHNNEVDNFELSLQACLEETICYPPEKFIISVSAGGKIVNTPPVNNNFLLKNNIPKREVKAENINTSPSLEQALSQSYFKSLIVVFFLGLGISFSACSYPLIPIVSSLVMGKTKGSKAYLLLLSYVLAMAFTMGALGAVFGLFDNFNLQAALQKPIFLIPVSLIFLILALALFDLFHLQMPRALQNFSHKLSQKQQSGAFLGAISLGVLSVLIVSPCASPVLTALLLYCTQKGIFWGFWALFVFGLANGLPLFLFAGFLRKFMPKSGEWLNIVKKVYAFLMLALAFYIFARILNNYFYWALWALYFVILSLYFRKNIIILVIASLFANFCIIQSSLHYYHNNVVIQNTNFQTIKIENLEAEIKNSNKKVLVDFYADWCVECKINERDFLNNPKYSNYLKDFNLLKIDITNYGEKEKELFKKLDLVAPPVILFYPAGGNYLNPERKIIGSLKNRNFF